LEISKPNVHKIQSQKTQSPAGIFKNIENVQQNIQIFQMCSKIWKWSKYSKRKISIWNDQSPKHSPLNGPTWSSNNMSIYCATCSG